MITETNARNMTVPELERYAYIGDAMAKKVLEQVVETPEYQSAAEILVLEEELANVRRQIDRLEDEAWLLERDIKKKKQGGLLQ